MTMTPLYDRAKTPNCSSPTAALIMSLRRDRAASFSIRLQRTDPTRPGKITIHAGTRRARSGEDRH
jgi:hypothetical protein